MFKAILLATSMLVAAPVFAQDKPATQNKREQAKSPPKTVSETPAADDAAPGTQGAGTVEAAAAVTTTAPVTEAAQPTPAQPAAEPAAPTASASAATSASVAAQRATTADQVGQAVARDFAGYDKDANGGLSTAEFNTWVLALRKAAEPAFEPGSAAGTSYASQAFAAADTDKNKAVSQAELTVFLTPKS